VRHFVTGCAGFVGSNLVDRLLREGHLVVGYDNFSTGQPEFLEAARKSPRFELVGGDVLDRGHLTRAMAGAEVVLHLAANADVRWGTQNPRRDLEQNTVATVNVLEAMRETGCRRIVFASSAAVYGEPSVFPTPEDVAFPRQSSSYGASKLAGEGFIQAYCEGFGLQAWILRMVSIVGERYSHGHIFDFVKQLRAHPNHLYVLGDGRQRKSYLDVDDCVEAFLLACQRETDSVNVFNLGSGESCTVDDSIGWICDLLGVAPERTYAGGERGWSGDSPCVLLDCRRLGDLGWRSTVGLRDGVIRTVRFLERNEWLLERR
jgi:UDP-glucose 4-epimerase